MQTFSMQVPINDPEKMKEFQELMNRLNDETNAYTLALAKELGVSDACAMDIVYLRTRSRHTPQLEQKLIELYAKGTPPHICDFGFEGV
jgi:hypothetical protein